LKTPATLPTTTTTTTTASLLRACEEGMCEGMNIIINRYDQIRSDQIRSDQIRSDQVNNNRARVRLFIIEEYEKRQRERERQEAKAEQGFEEVFILHQTQQKLIPSFFESPRPLNFPFPFLTPQSSPLSPSFHIILIVIITIIIANIITFINLISLSLTLSSSRFTFISLSI